MIEESPLDAPPEPNTGRILDYWLGGHHHFPADVAAAQAFDTMYGDWPGIFRALRRFTGRAVRFARDREIDQFLVLGSGIPAGDNVHEVVPDARVLYTDIDPVNVELGRRILAGNPRTGYCRCDAADLSTLDRGELDRVLGPLRRLAVVFVGVAVFIADDRLRRSLDELWSLAPPGSCLILDSDGEMARTLPGVIEALAAGGAPYYPRTPEMIAALLGKWRLTEEAIQPVSIWRNPTPDLNAPHFSYGGVALKDR